MSVFLIIDDHPVVRRGIRQILEEMSGDIQVYEAGRAADGLRKIRESDIDIVLLDINLPGRSGLDMLKDIRKIKPETKVLIISMYPEEQYAIRVLKSGAQGYVTKESAPDELLIAVDRILKGGRYITQSIAEQIFDTFESNGPLHQSLSNREYEVLIHLSKGRNIKEIADLLALSSKTISTYRRRILEKMKMQSNIELVRYALQHKLIE